MDRERWRKKKLWWATGQRRRVEKWGQQDIQGGRKKRSDGQHGREGGMKKEGQGARKTETGTGSKTE